MFSVVFVKLHSIFAEKGEREPISKTPINKGEKRFSILQSTD